MDLSPDGKFLAVACQRSRDIWLLDLNAKVTASGPQALEERLAARVDTGPVPVDLLFEEGGRRLLVTESDNDSVDQVSLEQGRITRRFKVLPEPGRLEPLPGPGTRILISSTTVTGFGVFRGASLRPEKNVILEGLVSRMLPSKDFREILAVTHDSGAFVRVRLADLSPQWSLAVKGSPVDLALSPDGRFAWVAGAGKIFDQTQGEKAPEPGALSCVRLQDSRVVNAVELCPGACALEISRSGKYLYVLCGDEGLLEVYDSSSLALKDSMPLHGDPDGLLLSSDGSSLFVAQADLKQVSELDLGPYQ
jgi:DNA-binding beta-propeller fold protein YncE